MHSSDIIGLIILSTLYLLQGIAMGLKAGSLPIILIAKGASYADISMIGFAAVAFPCKILWASFLDKHFIKSFGKRKTYIIPCKYIVSLIYIIYSYRFEDDIETLNITPIFIAFFTILTLEATADIATDGWVLTILSEENVALGPTCQSFGQSMGWFISQFIFVQLTSVKFANDYVYSQPSTEPLVSYGGYLRFWGIVTLIFTFLIHFFKKETNPSTKEFSSVWEVYKTLKGFYLNKNLRFICFILITYKFGLIFMESAGFLELVKRGLPKETLTTIGIIVYPVQFIGPIWVVKYILKKLEFTIVFVGIFVSIFFMIGMMFTISTFQNAKDAAYILFLITAMQILFQVSRIMLDVPFGAFNTRICDERYGGTFITALASISSIYRILQPVGLSLLYYMNFYVVNAIGAIYSVGFIYKFAGKCIMLQSAPKQIWSFELNSENKDYFEMKDAKIPHEI